MEKQFYNNFKLGILGGGQLGRMLIQESINYDLNIRVLDSDKNAPCRAIAHQFVEGSIVDFNTVYNFGKECDLITIEIENVNCEALKKLESEGVTIYPRPDTIALIQDKGLQKEFYHKHQIPTAPYILTENRNDLLNHSERLPAVHKLRREGYDGRGVQLLKSAADIEKGFDKPAVLESMVDIEKEISIIAARSSNGEVALYPPVELVFNNEYNLVDYLLAPARLEPAVEQSACTIARSLISELEHVGLLVIEMFLTTDGEVLVNELAPRPHNSGHHTMKANQTSQFDQHLRAILNLPLGETSALRPCAMLNLLGAPGHTGPVKYVGLEEAISSPGVSIHLYGKTTTRPFRKMGHLIITGEKYDTVIDTLKSLKDKVRVET